MLVWKIIFFVLQNSQAYPKQNSLTFSLSMWSYDLYGFAPTNQHI